MPYDGEARAEIIELRKHIALLYRVVGQLVVWNAQSPNSPIRGPEAEKILNELREQLEADT